jgi:predicted small integral membrane protein
LPFKLKPEYRRTAAKPAMYSRLNVWARFTAGTFAAYLSLTDERASFVLQDVSLREVGSMIARSSKLMLLAGIALFYALVVFNNVTDFGSNYEFVRHVLTMDSTFPGNHGLWRALRSPRIHLAFYISIIAWEIVTAILLWWASIRMLGALRGPVAAFNAAKRVAIVALTLSMLLWLVAFLSVGAEWFLMWQSHTWNGQEEAFRMFVVVGLVLLLVLQPETEGQP